MLEGKLKPHTIEEYWRGSCEFFSAEWAPVVLVQAQPLHQSQPMLWLVFYALSLLIRGTVCQVVVIYDVTPAFSSEEVRYPEFRVVACQV